MRKKIQIPKKYQADIEYRFNPDNAELTEDQWRINRACPLCVDFMFRGCIGCPFDLHRKKTDDLLGCVIWIQKITGEDFNFWDSHVGYINWWKVEDKQARAQLRKLHKEAKKYIEWV